MRRDASGHKFNQLKPISETLHGHIQHLLEPDLLAMIDAPALPELTDEAVVTLRQMMAGQAPQLVDPAAHGLRRSELQAPLDGETSGR